MTAADLTLYVDSLHLSPYAMSTCVALREKGLDFELVTVDLERGANLAQGFARRSITQRVPTLVHGDFSLSESSAIAEYVDETFPGTALYPRDPRDRARARQTQAWLRSDLAALRQERPTTVVFLAPVGQALSADGVKARDRLIEAAEALVPADHLELFGTWSIADTDLALMLMRLLRNGDPVPARLAAYAEHQWRRPSVQAWCGLSRRR
jgi:glutathione S-transferase